MVRNSAEFGRLDFACNIAGIQSGACCSPARMRRSGTDHAANLKGVPCMKHELGPMLTGARVIVNMASVAGLLRNGLLRVRGVWHVGDQDCAFDYARQGRINRLSAAVETPGLLSNPRVPANTERIDAGGRIGSLRR